jgi:heme exporter protein C
VYIALIGLLIALLALSPAEARLGNVVKLVYAHGAAMRVALYAYAIAAAVGIAYLATRRESLARWARAFQETAIVFWIAHFVVSLPAQQLAWGGIAWTEPRVLSAVWILLLTVFIFGVARWMGDARAMASAAIANAMVAIVLMRGAINVLHPIDPILGSDSIAIKGFYLAIVLTTGILAFQFARDRART